MSHPNGSPDSFEKQQHELCNAFARAAAAMRDAAQTAESFSNWFSRANNAQSLMYPMFDNPFLANFPRPHQPQPPFQPMPAPAPPEPEQTGKKRKASGEMEGAKKKRQAREKKPKDVNAPKRPPSAYILFQNEVRKAVQTQHPDVPYNQILTEIAKMWKEMTPKEKEPYVQATADSKVLYEKAKADYELQSPTTESPEKPVELKSKSQVAVSSAVSKSAEQAATSSDDESSSEPTSESTSSTSNDEADEQEQEQKAKEKERGKGKENEKEKVKEKEKEKEVEMEKEKEKTPKKTKKVPKPLTPPPAKVEKEKRKKSGEGKKKKKKTEEDDSCVHG